MEVTRGSGRRRLTQSVRLARLVRSFYFFSAESRRSAALARSQLYGWKGTCLEGRPGPEIGNFGNLQLGNTLDAPAYAKAMARQASGSVSRDSRLRHRGSVLFPAAISSSDIADQ